MTTKILALTDALGNLVRFVLLPDSASTQLAFRRLLRDWPSMR